METIGTKIEDNLIAGDFPLVTEERTVAESQTLARGTVLGVITADDEVVPTDSGAEDGSHVLDCVLSEDVVTEAAETKVVTVYITGEFQEDGLVFGGTDTAASRKADARAKSIFFKGNEPA